MEAEAKTNWKLIFDSSGRLQEGEMYVIFTDNFAYHLTMFAGNKFHGKSKQFKIAEISHFFHVPAVNQR